jgi:hypothetical protein
MTAIFQWRRSARKRAIRARRHSILERFDDFLSAVVELFRADRSSFQLEKEVITGRRIVPQEETRRSSFKSRKEDGFHHLASNPASKFVELGTWRRKRFRTRTWRRQSLPKNRRTRSSAV